MQGKHLVVLEAMESEVVIVAPVEGVVERVHCVPGGMVTAGQNLVTLRVSTDSTAGTARHR